MMITSQEGLYHKQKISKPTYSEIANKLLTNEMSHIMNHLINYMESLKLKPHWYATNSFHFKYKGKIIFRFSIGGNGINLFQTVVDKNDLDKTLLLLTDDMRNFYFNNLRFCNHCNPKHGDGKPYQIRNNNYFICAEPEMYFHNPNKEQIEMIAKFVNIRRDSIRA